MALFGKMQDGVVIKTPAPVIFDFFAKKISEAPKYSRLHKVELLEGEWGEVGSVMNWYFLFEGKSFQSKELFEVLDEKNLSVTYKVIGGSILEAYKSFTFIAQAIPKGEGCFVTWTIEYEKLSVDVPDPKPMMQFALDLIRDIEANLV